MYYISQLYISTNFKIEIKKNKIKFIHFLILLLNISQMYFNNIDLVEIINIHLV